MRSLILFTLCILLNNFVYANTKIESAILDNGMKIFVIENHRFPIINHMLFYNVGGENDPKGKSGLAHFLEHLMFRGTHTIKDITSIIQKNGGSFNATTSHYYTNYYETIAKNKLELIMKIESDRMQNLEITDDAIIAERKIVAEERRMRIENSPEAQLEEEMLSAFYHNDNGWQVAGWMNEILTLEKNNARYLYDNFYHPNNAILLITGDTTMKEVLPLATKHYGAISSKELPVAITLYEPQHKSNIRINLEHADVKKQECKIWYQAPNISNKHSLPLKLATIILANSRSSYLYKQLVLENKAVAVSAYYEPYTKKNTILEFQVIPTNNDVPIDRLVIDIINNTINSGIDEKDLQIAKNMFKTSLIYKTENIMGQAAFYGNMIMSDSRVKNLQSLEMDIDKITVEQVNDALKEILLDKKTVIGYLNTQEK